MNIGILYIGLVAVGIIIGLVLVWFLVELVLTLRKTRAKVDELHEQITPTLKNVEQITEKIQPAIDKVDPLVERISLTVDAANLELMRADQILENVNVITEGVAGATTAVGNIASAPAELVNRASGKIQDFFTGGSSAGSLEEGSGHLAGNEISSDINSIEKSAKKQGKIFARRARKKAAKAAKVAAGAASEIIEAVDEELNGTQFEGSADDDFSTAVSAGKHAKKNVGNPYLNLD